MASFDDSIKEEIRARIDIAALIGRYVNLKPSGQTLKGLCPFHKEKTPSFHVNPARGFYHCFGCKRGGDIFKFIEEVEGVGFAEALSMLADECGIELQRQQPSPSYIQNQKNGGTAVPQLNKQELFKIHDLAAGYFYSNIKGSQEAVSYFKSRGLLPETVRAFRLGYAPEGWSSLIDFCKGNGIPSAALIACGLAVKNETGRIYDRFRNRIIFSLSDLSGRVIGFAGRGLSSDAVPKYLNSPETLLYKKKRFLYGLDQARQAIKKKQSVIVVEGYMDYLTLYQAGIRHVVATSGTALTPEHAQLLGRFTGSIILIFDGDTAGMEAAERAVFTLAPANLDLSVLTLPDGEDPDSVVKNGGKETFESLIENARYWSDFIIDRMITTHTAATPRGKSLVINSLAPLVQSIRDEITTQQFKQKLAEKLGIDERTIYRKLPDSRQRSTRDTRGPSLSADERYCGTLEGSFLRILIARPELINEARTYVTPETLTDGISGDIYYLILDTFDRNRNLNGISDATDNPEIKRTIAMLQVKETVTENIHEELVQKIIHLRKKFLRFKERECRVQMKQQPHRRSELLHQINEYITQLHELDGGE
jgi:DNA primase